MSAAPESTPPDAGAAREPQPRTSAARAPGWARAPGCLGAGLCVLFALLAAEAFGTLGRPWFESLYGAWVLGGWSALFGAPLARIHSSGFGLRDACLALALAIGLAWALLERAALARFLGARATRRALATCALVALAARFGLPQLGSASFDAPRVTAESYAVQQAAFAQQLGARLARWCTPSAEDPSGADASGDAAARTSSGAATPSVAELAALGPELAREARASAAQAERERALQLRGARFASEHAGALELLFQFATLLQLNRVFAADWFAGLAALIAASIACWGWRELGQAQRSLASFGRAFAALGALIALLGACQTRCFAERGRIELASGRSDPQDRIELAAAAAPAGATSGTARLPFGLRLERVATRATPALELRLAGAAPEAARPHLRAEPGRELALDWSATDERGAPRARLALRVLALAPRARVHLPALLAAPPGEAGVTVFELELPDDGEDLQLPGTLSEALGDGRRRVYLSPELPSQLYLDAQGQYRLRASAAPQTEAPEARAALFPGATAALGLLEIELADAPGERETLALALDRELRTRAGYALRVLAATRDFKLEPRDGRMQPRSDERPLAEQDEGLAAVQLEIRSPDGARTEQRWVVDGFDEPPHATAAAPALPELRTRLRWNRWSAPGAPRFALLRGAQGAQLLGEDGSLAALEPGAPLPLPGERAAVLLALHERVRLRAEVEPLAAAASSSGVDADFYAEDPIALELELTRDPGTPSAHSERVWLAGSDQNGADRWRAADGGCELALVLDGALAPPETRALVSLWRQDAAGQWARLDAAGGAGRELRAQAPLEHEDYRLQLAAGAQHAPDGALLEFVFDPGARRVRIGLAVLALGVALAWLALLAALARGLRSRAS